MEEACLPLLMRRPGARGAVLLIHGFTGYPGELARFSAALFRLGYTVSAPRLPGHGTSRADFMATGAEDWLRRARDAYLDMEAEYGVAGIVGHSMGGAIALVLAADYAPSRVALLAPAVELADRRIPLASLIGRFRPVIKGRASPPPEDLAGERLRLHPEYWSDTMVGQAGQLYRLVKASRSALPRVRSALLVVSGERDASVPAAAAERIARDAIQATSIRQHTIAGAGHCFPFDGNGTDEALRIVEEFFSS